MLWRFIWQKQIFTDKHFQQLNRTNLDLILLGICIHFLTSNRARQSAWGGRFDTCPPFKILPHLSLLVCYITRYVIFHPEVSHDHPNGYQYGMLLDLSIYAYNNFFFQLQMLPKLLQVLYIASYKSITAWLSLYQSILLALIVSGPRSLLSLGYLICWLIHPGVKMFEKS